MKKKKKVTTFEFYFKNHFKNKERKFYFLLHNDMDFMSLWLEIPFIGFHLVIDYIRKH